METSLLETRFWDRVWQGDGCWLWTGTTTKGGYGNFTIGKRGTPASAHRFAYELMVGPIPSGFEIDHLCHDPATCGGGTTCIHRSCVNPDHMEPVTHAENMRRGSGAKTHCKYGHEFTPENTLISAVNPKTNFSQRRCRACHRETERQRRAGVK